MSQPPTAIRIDDPADPRVAAYRDIRERDLVGREGRFVAEGEVVLRMLAASSRHRAESVLIDERRLDRLAPLLAALAADTPVYAAGQAVIDAIAGFHLHRGILAIGRSAPDPGAAALLARLPARALVLALFGLSNHDNMGGAFRNAAAFGADAVLIDSGCCDPLYRKAIRVSVGHALTVPFARLAPVEDPLALLAEARLEPLALTPRGATPLAELDPPARAAVLLGTEGEGLPARIIAGSRPVAIPMAPGVDSLNVAVTAGIVLHHLRFGGRG
ncbi:MAG TPA: RNA methyltransferase [Caulobacteraceae bacterium]|nr:RNA methyltransferase [Caulobacteraceae bacterium]